MAVSINVYRCRIGNFHSSRIGFRKQIKKNSKSKRKSESNILRLVWVIAIIIATSTCNSTTKNSNTSAPSTDSKPSPKSSSHIVSPINTPSSSRKAAASAPNIQTSMGNSNIGYSNTSASSTDSKPSLKSNSNTVPSSNSSTSYPNLSRKAAASAPVIAEWPWIVPAYLTSKFRNFLARMINGNRRDHGIKIQHWNKGPAYLANKHQEIEALISTNKPHVLGLSEANFHLNHDYQEVQHPDYDLHVASTLNNPQLNVARVVVYTHKSLRVVRRADLENNTISSVWLEVGLPRKKKILMCHAYREWKYLGQGSPASGTLAAQQVRWSALLSQWETAIAEDKEVLVLMDANIDFLKWTADNLPAGDGTARLRPLIDELFTRIFPHGVSQLVTAPTRSWPGHPDSGLDHVYSNKPEKLSKAEVEFVGGSDHKLIKIVRFSKSLAHSARYVRKRCYKEFSEAEFCARVQQISWFELYMVEEVDVAVNIITEKISKILDELAPIKTIQIRTRYAPWLTKETKALIKERNNVQKLAAESGDPDDWRMFKNMRNNVTKVMRQEKKAWEQARLNHQENNPTILWKSIKSWLNWKTTGPPSQLFHEGELVKSPAHLADVMNKFFVNKVEGLKRGIPASALDPLKTLREVMRDRQCQFTLQPVTPEQVLEIIKSLKNSKSTGMDFIDTHIIKLVAIDILPAITHIVNLSIRDAYFPTTWKKAKVVPLLKKGDSFDPKNYRPVALLNIMSKILERAVYLQLVEYLDSNQLLHPNHHGSRRAHSTCTALLQMYDTWVQAVDDGNMAGVMMIDLSAAFDMVDHAILLQKLELLGLNNMAVAWFGSYLQGRSQTVCIDGSLAKFLDIDCGVPQGSVLGPLLYVLFTNDLPDVVHEHEDLLTYREPNMHCDSCGGLVNFVDDATYTFACSDPAQMSDQLSSTYKRVSNYMASNKLVINADKTHLLVMGTRGMNSAREEVSLVAGDHMILPSSTEKLLGCNIHENLKWGHHIRNGEKSLFRQLTSRVNALSKMAVNATFETRLMAANGAFISVLSYLIPLWGGTEGYLIKGLQVLQNRAARCVTRLSWFTPTRTLMAKCKWLSIKQLVYYHSVLQVHKVLRNGAPLYLSEKLVTEHPYPTRQATSGGLRYTSSNTGHLNLTQQSFLGRSAGIYNSIPSSIRTTTSLNTFKQKLKTWIKSNVPIE